MKIQTLKYEYNSKEAPCDAVAQSRAKRYIAQSECRRKLKRKALDAAITALFLLVLVLPLCIKTFTMENRYAIPYDDGALHYIYVTERICTVTEIVGDCVTVEYKGNSYSFYGYGYEIGQTIICKFTDDWEIVGVVE